jgi:hypothetical protein
MATGSLNTQGVWLYGEDDSETTFSALLNKLGNSVSSTLKGRVVQVVSATRSVSTSSTSSTPVTTGLTASITPQYSTSRIIVQMVITGIEKSGDSNTSATVLLYKDGSNVQKVADFLGFAGAGNIGDAKAQYVEIAGSTSVRSFTGFFNRSAGSGTIFVNNNTCVSTMLIMEVTA